MPSTEEQIKNIISRHQGKIHKQQIAMKLKIGLDYTDLVCKGLERKKEIIFSRGWCSSLPQRRIAKRPKVHTKKISSAPSRSGKRVLKKSKSRSPAVKHSRSKQKKSVPSPETKFSLSDIPGMSKKLIRIAEKAGYKTIESLAEAPLVKLMEATKLKLSETAGLINKAREYLKRIGE